MRCAGWLAAALLLQGCGPSEAPEPAPDRTAAAVPNAGSSVPAPAAAAPVEVALDAEGLRFVAADSGKASLLAFATKREQVERAVRRAVGGSPERSTGEECPAGPTQFTRFGALQLAFQDDRWIGWALNGSGAQTTLDGIGIGTTRRDAEATRTVTAVPGSTLGEEFVLDSPEDETAIGGIFDGPGADARIEYLWAGVACNFR